MEIFNSHILMIQHDTYISQSWPEDALQAVASRFLEEIEMGEEERAGCIRMCKHFHTSTRDVSDFLNKAKLEVFVGKKSYYNPIDMKISWVLLLNYSLGNFQVLLCTKTAKKLLKRLTQILFFKLPSLKDIIHFSFCFNVFYLTSFSTYPFLAENRLPCFHNGQKIIKTYTSNNKMFLPKL